MALALSFYVFICILLKAEIKKTSRGREKPNEDNKPAQQRLILNRLKQGVLTRQQISSATWKALKESERKREQEKKAIKAKKEKKKKR